MTGNPRRPSYASVASGSAAMNPSRMNTLAAFGHSNQSSASIPTPQQPHREARRQASRGSLRSMEIDGQGGGESWRQASKGNAQGENGRMGCSIHEEHLPFFTPSYLRRSRHVGRLRKSWDEHLQELRENGASQPTAPVSKPALSARSSNTNLSKLHGSHHRLGVVQDVIERIPPPTEEDKSHPLPSRWSEDDRMSGLEILGERGQGTEVRFNGVAKGDHEAASVRADHPMPKEVGMYYYEVTVLSRGKEGWIGIGFSGKRVSLNRLPGWETDSWAYHGDDGYSFACTASGKAYGPRYAAYDVVGCGVNFRTGNAFFTKNGVYLGVAFSGVKGDKLYPSVGVRKPGEHLRANFGRTPFVFDIERMMDEERRTIMSEIRAADVSQLHPPDDENKLIHNLIGQYFAHEGYVETAKAFASDVHEQQQSLSTQPLERADAEDDIHAANRQKIRRAILDGDIDKALKYTNSFYPHVLEEERNKDVYFQLRCRKFIEMMRRYTELSSDAGENSAASNGHAGTAIADENEDEGDEDEDEQEEDETDGHANHPIDTQMELDDQLHREASAPTTITTSAAPPKLPQIPTDDIDMDIAPSNTNSDSASTSTATSPTKATAMQASTLLNAAIAYGQELQRTFGADPRPGVKKTLSDIFAIMAYTDPVGSVVGGLMREAGRVRIAEEVNGAILVSLGKPSSAALEKLCADTEALLDQTAGKSGSAAAFVNTRCDFLKEDEWV